MSGLDAAPGLLSWVITTLSSATLGGIAYTIRLLTKHEKSIDKHEQTLYGPNEENGLRGDMKGLLSLSIGYRLEDHGERIDALEEHPHLRRPGVA